MSIHLFKNGTLSGRKKAVAYYRHSAEDKQENSVPIQREHVHKFAALHDIEIIHEEADEGKTGLLANRPGFVAVFRDWVENDAALHFDYVLVFDVSRWGRFQDQDQAAHYEYICKMRGKQVIYVARGFPKEEHKLIGHLQTSIERYMAAEYSRQLSEKVFHGCVHISKQGFSAGGPPCYGMQRILLDESHRPIRALKKGEHKQISNQRVTFAPRDDETAVTVRTMFRELVYMRKTPPQIVSELNEKNIRSPSGGKWGIPGVLRVLRNETYSGTRIYNRTWNRLKQGRRKNPVQEWIRVPHAFDGIVETEMFERAQLHLDEYDRKKDKETFIISLEYLRKSVLRQVRGFLEAQGYTDSLWMIMRSFPLTCSVALRCEGNHSWHFLLHGELWCHENILCSGFTSEFSLICFWVPRSVFGASGLWSVDWVHGTDNPYLVSGKTLEQMIINAAMGCMNLFDQDQAHSMAYA